MRVGIVEKGGPGSGFHGHAGRPGHVGGSAAGSGGSWKNGPVKFLDGGSLELRGKSNTSVAIMDDGTTVIHKKQNARLQEFRGISALGEEAAYETATKYLGYDDLVPRTVAIDKDTSVQELLTDGSTAYDIFDGNIDRESFKQLVILDMVTGNGDRHLGNIWVMPDGKVRAIDNDHAYSSKRAYGVNTRTDVIRDALWNGENAYEQLTGNKLNINPDEYQSVARELHGNTDFHNYIATFVGSDAWNHMDDRLQDMMEY